MGQWFRAFAFLPEDWVIFPEPTQWLTTVVTPTPVPGNPMSFMTSWAPEHIAYRQTCKHTDIHTQ